MQSPVSHHHDRRHVPRTPAVGRVWLTAVECARLEPGSRLEALITDISAAAAGLVVQAPLEQGDRLELAGSLFGVPLDVEVTVASARPSELQGEIVAGCEFEGSMTGDQRIALERVVLARIAQDDLGLGARFALGA
jgi:PilZ domain